MLPSLSSIVPGFALTPQAPSKILLEDSTQCSGEWLTYSMLDLFLRDPTSTVVFVASQQYFTHYQTVLKKMSGLSLTTFLESKQLKFIDAFTQPFKNITY